MEAGERWSDQEVEAAFRELECRHPAINARGFLRDIRATCDRCGADLTAQVQRLMTSAPDRMEMHTAMMNGLGLTTLEKLLEIQQAEREYRMSQDDQP